MRLTDTHCHLDFNKFDEDREAVIQRAIDAGVIRMLIPALDLDSSRAGIKLAEAYPFIFAAVGFHPTDLDRWNDSAMDNLRALIVPHRERDSSVTVQPLPQNSMTKKIVAIGEIGLDYYWIKESEKRALQGNVLKQQLKLAQEVNKPVIIHMREENDTWFNGNLETAQKALALNFYIGVTGPVTYKNAEAKRQIIRELPLERLLIETDSPFLTPVPHRGKRNEPAFVAHIADKIAEIQLTTSEQVAEISTLNAARLFGWGG